MGKYIGFFLVCLVVTVAVAIAVPLALNDNLVMAASEKPSYLYTLAMNDKDKFIVTNLADGRLVRLQLILELDGDRAPKDLKNPGREILALQDSLLQTVRRCRSTDLDPQNQTAFKKKMVDAAGQIIGKHSIRGVYVAGVAVQ